MTKEQIKEWVSATYQATNNQESNPVTVKIKESFVKVIGDFILDHPVIITNGTRELSEMSKSEIRQVISLEYNPTIAKAAKNLTEGLFMIDYEFDNQPCCIYFNKINPKTTIFLLSRGFKLDI